MTLGVHFSGTLSVRDYLPLQQGLRRRKHYRLALVGVLVRDYLPLQQGLRPVLVTRTRTE